MSKIWPKKDTLLCPCLYYFFVGKTHSLWTSTTHYRLCFVQWDNVSKRSEYWEKIHCLLNYWIIINLTLIIKFFYTNLFFLYYILNLQTKKKEWTFVFVFGTFQLAHILAACSMTKPYWIQLVILKRKAKQMLCGPTPAQHVVHLRVWLEHLSVK